MHMRQDNMGVTAKWYKFWLEKGVFEILWYVVQSVLQVLAPPTHEMASQSCQKKTIQITKWCSVVTKREKFLSPYPLPTTILEKSSKTLKTTILQVMKILLQSCKKTFGHETCTQVRFITGDIKQEMWKEQKSIYAILYFVFWYLIQIFLATNIS